MTDLTTFPFTRLPLDLQLHVVNQLPSEDLYNFRQTCSDFYQLTNQYANSIKRKDLRGLFIDFKSKAVDFQTPTIKKMRYVDAPTDRFWSSYQHISLKIDELHKADQEHFLQKLDNFHFRIEALRLHSVRPAFVQELLQRLPYAKEIFFFSTRFYSDKFLTSDVLKDYTGSIVVKHPQDFKRIKGRVIRYVSEEIKEPVPVQGINHMLKGWVAGEYKFRELMVDPIKPDTDLEGLFEGIKMKRTVFDEEHHSQCLLKMVDKRLLTARITIKKVVVVKNEEDNLCLLSYIFDDRIHFERVPESECIEKTLKFLFYDHFFKDMSPEVLQSIYAQPLF